MRMPETDISGFDGDFGGKEEPSERWACVMARTPTSCATCSLTSSRVRRLGSELTATIPPSKPTYEELTERVDPDLEDAAIMSVGERHVVSLYGIDCKTKAMKSSVLAFNAHVQFVQTTAGA